MRKAFSARRHGWRRLVSSGAAVLGVLGGALVTTASVEAVTDGASAAPTSLGTTPAVFGYNEYSSSDSSLGSPSGMSIAGTLVVGGDLDVPTGDKLSVGTAESGLNVLDVAGNLTGAGTLCVGGTNNQGKYLGTSTVQPGPGCGGLGESPDLQPSAFQFIGSEAGSISSGWASIRSNGTEQLWSGNLTLTGTASTLQVFNVPSSDFVGAQTLTINIPAGTAQVLINVVQTSPGPLSVGALPLAAIVYPNGSASAPNTWFNFPDASSVTFAGLDMNANVLAPNGVVAVYGGQLDGYVYAASLDGSFTGQVPSATTITGPLPSCPCTTTTTTTTVPITTTTTTQPTTTTTTPPITTTTTQPTTTNDAADTTTTPPPPTTQPHDHDHGAHHDHDHGAHYDHDDGADHHDDDAADDDNHGAHYDHDDGADHHDDDAADDDNHGAHYDHDDGPTTRRRRSRRRQPRRTRPPPRPRRPSRPRLRAGRRQRP